MFFKDGRKPVCTSVQSVANQTKYWSEETEQQLANLVEDPAKPAFDKIKVRQPITPRDKWMLSRYIITLLKRVPARRAKMLSRAPALWRETMDKVAKVIEEEKRTVPSSSAYLDQMQRQLDDIPPDFLDVIPPLVWEQVLSPEMTIEAVRVIHQMKWTFFVAQPEKGFITSDNPVIYTEGKGLKPPEGELVFPVCRDVALWAHWTNTLGEAYYPVIKTVLDEINFWLVSSASDYVFYSGNKNFVSSLIKRAHRRSQRQNAAT